MQRVTITLDDELIIKIDRIAQKRGYQNRSEAMRDLVRSGLAAQESSSSGRCMAALVYIYDHDSRELAKRLTRTFHDHHDLSIAGLHVHLDRESCMEVAVLRGAAPEIQRFADHITAQRGVRHGRLITLPIAADRKRHARDRVSRQLLHAHARGAT